MEGFRFVTLETALNRPNTGKEDDNDDDYPNKIWRRVQITKFLITQF
jgi:hypothetical protein